MSKNHITNADFKTMLSKLQVTAKVPGGPRNDFVPEKAGN